MKLSPTSEPITDSFIDAACTVASRMLIIEVVRKALALAEETYGHENPLDSVTKLQAIISKAKSAEAIRDRATRGQRRIRQMMTNLSTLFPSSIAFRKSSASECKSQLNCVCTGACVLWWSNSVLTIGHLVSAVHYVDRLLAARPCESEGLVGRPSQLSCLDWHG